MEVRSSLTTFLWSIHEMPAELNIEIKYRIWKHSSLMCSFQRQRLRMWPQKITHIITTSHIKYESHTDTHTPEIMRPIWWEWWCQQKKKPKTNNFLYVLRAILFVKCNIYIYETSSSSTPFYATTRRREEKDMTSSTTIKYLYLKKIGLWPHDTI